MPPKIKTSKEMIIEAGYKIADRVGIENVNCRAIAAELGVSTQPVFSRFPNMDELKHEVLLHAIEELENAIRSKVAEVMQNGGDEERAIESTLLVLSDMARNHKNLYKLVYLSTYCSETTFEAFRETYSTNQELLELLIKTYGFSKERGEIVYQRLALLTQGLCAVIATTAMHYTDEEVISIVMGDLHDAIQSGLE